MMYGRLHIDTYGCRTNVADSSALAAHLVKAGLTITKYPETADVVLVNSCTVTAGADRDAGKGLRRARRASPQALLVLTGCLPAAHSNHPALEHADVVVQGNDPKQVVQAIQAALIAPSPTARQGLSSAFPLEEARNLSRVNIKIMEGCDNFCTYCIVPIARGKPTSRPTSAVLAAIESAVDSGFREVVITGTNLARYGRDLGQTRGLPGLMDDIERLDPKCRLRLSSLEPDEQLEPVIERIASSRRWCRHIHLAVQHGADRVLELMGRHYRLADIARFASTAADSIQGLSLGLDVIAGFPGESPEDFQVSAQRIEDLPFSYLHVFPYSPRPGTPAAAMSGRPALEETRTRARTLREMSAVRKQRFEASFEGQRLEVLIERRRHRESGLLHALSDNYLKVFVDGSDALHRSLIDCTVGLRPDLGLVGRILTERESNPALNERR